jgi:hypothetical protein
MFLHFKHKANKGGEKEWPNNQLRELLQKERESLLKSLQASRLQRNPVESVSTLDALFIQCFSTNFK